MKKTTWVITGILALLFAGTAYAGFQTLNSSGASVGTLSGIECSTGLTCTADGKYLKLVSSPTLTGTTLSLSSTLAATGDFAINTNKFNVTASSGNTAIAGTADVVGNFSVATNKFNVTAASGNTAIAGTANVVGDFSVATNKFTAAAASGNTAIAGTLTVTGASTFTGGIVAGSGQRTNYIGWRPSTLTAGTSTTPSATVVYLTQIMIEANATITGIKVSNGATVGTNKYIVALFDSSGSPVANSALAGANIAGADGYQTVAFTGTYAAKGPGIFWIGLYVNGTTDRFRSVPAVGEYGGLAGSVSGQTFGTVAAVVLPTTFSADLGPVAFTY